MAFPRRAALLLTTTLAWGIPTVLAMRLDALRFLEPYVDPHPEKGYVQTYAFQYLAFWFRSGWVLLIAFFALLGVRVALTRTAPERQGDL